MVFAVPINTETRRNGGARRVTALRRAAAVGRHADRREPRDRKRPRPKHLALSIARFTSIRPRCARARRSLRCSDPPCEIRLDLTCVVESCGAKDVLETAIAFVTGVLVHVLLRG